MTRLTSRLIAEIGRKMKTYDTELQQKTGSGLIQIAARVAGMTEDDASLAFNSAQAAVIPVTAGEGAIAGFSQSVQSILHHMGCPAFVTTHSDVAGLAEGIERGAGIVFLADDIRYVAINLSNGILIDNSKAAGWSYAFALDSLVGGLRGHRVLLIGAGKVGEHALCALSYLGALTGVFDTDNNKSKTLAHKFNMIFEEDIADALKRYTVFFDASPAPGIILPEHIKPETAIAACGIPMGLSKEAQILAVNRLIHDPLQLGTAAMLAMAIRHYQERK